MNDSKIMCILVGIMGLILFFVDFYSFINSFMFTFVHMPNRVDNFEIAKTALKFILYISIAILCFTLCRRQEE